MKPLRLTLLGAPRVEREDQPVSINRRKSLALIAYLATTGKAHSRDTLATLLWPEVSQRRARGNLRRALSDLNQLLGKSVFVLDGETVALDQENGLSSDVTQFRHFLTARSEHAHAADQTCPECLPLLAEAVALYQADFLAGFTLPDTVEFDDWQTFEADGLRREYGTALARLVDGLLEQGDYEAAIAHARRWVALDRLYEPAQQQLMRVYALSGRRHEALRQYQTCAETLEVELGVAPSPETEALYQRIASGELSPAPVTNPKPTWLPPAPTAVEVERTTPLLGREQELETITSKLQSGWKQQGQTILLAGVSGVGKTRLAYEVLQTAAQSGMTTLLGAAYEQEGRLAYHPFIEAIDRDLVEQKRPPDQNPITHYKPLGVTDPQQEHTALFKATAAFFTQLAANGPVMLLLDDLHAADEASLSMFHYLARQTRLAPVILLATYRTDVPINGISPFGSLLNALYREQLSDVVDLSPLTDEAGASLIRHTLAGPAAPQLVQNILDTAEGNPFYVQEICRALQKADALIPEDDHWALRPGAAIQVPSGLQELLRARAQRLGKTVDSTLSAAAVFGREFRFAVLREVTGLFDGDLFDALDAALDAQLIEETEDGYRFQHSLIRQSLYDALSRRRRAWLHARAAEAIEIVDGERRITEQVEALAHHYELSDRRELALPHLLEAAEKAASLFALEIASDYLQRAVVIMDELDMVDPARRWPILEKLGNWAKVLADTSRAIASYEQALALSPTGAWQPNPGDRVRVHRALARTFIAAGRMAEAESQLLEAMRIVVGLEQASPDYANLLYDMALWHWHNDAHQESFAAAQQSLAIAEQLDDDRARAQAYEMLALACHSLGEWQQGLNFEQQRSTLIGPNLDVTEAFDAHL
jgi:DNA-binding SARP family transcriptional activator